jgi:hypothetical protein
MKQLFSIALFFGFIFSSCSTSQGITNVQPKSGTITIPAKGEFRMWQNVTHGAFTVTLANSSPNQSVELYKVKSNGSEKWISPSLLANSSQQVTIPADGHLFIKNFNDNAFTISYQIAE